MGVGAAVCVQVPALLAVGLEGCWGLLLCCFVLPVTSLVHTRDGRAVDDAVAAVRAMMANRQLSLAVYSSILSIAFFNFFGVSGEWVGQVGGWTGVMQLPSPLALCLLPVKCCLLCCMFTLRHPPEAGEWDNSLCICLCSVLAGHQCRGGQLSTLPTTTSTWLGMRIVAAAFALQLLIDHVVGDILPFSNECKAAGCACDDAYLHVGHACWGHRLSLKLAVTERPRSHALRCCALPCCAAQ